MPSVPLNGWAILVAALASIVVGGLWYGPLFGKTWMSLMGMNPEECKGKMVWSLYLTQFIACLVMSFVLAHSLIFASTFLKVSGWTAGLMVGFWSWLGFVAPVTLGTVLWEGKSWKLWVLNNAHYLVSLLIMGVILSLWR